MSSEIEETCKRLMSHKGVANVIIYNSEGIVVRTAPPLEQKEAVQYPGLLTPLVTKTNDMIKALDQTNEFSTMRIRSQKNEILIYPDKEYTLVVVQSA